jgi:hypothetical protein
VLEIRELRIIVVFGLKIVQITGGCRKLYNEELHNC